MVDLTTVGLETGAPEIGSPALKQTHVLTPLGIETGAPVLGDPMINVEQRVLWPWPINWGGGVDETFEFMTNVIDASRDRREQRRALRVRPRKTWEFQSLRHRDAFRAAQRSLVNRYDQHFYFPLPVYGVKLAAPAVSGTSDLSIESTPAWLTVGEVYAITRKSDVELVRVSSISGTDLTIGGLLEDDWPDSAYLRPVDQCLYTGSGSIKMLTDAVAQLSVVLQTNPQSTHREAVDAAGTLFDGREVFTKRPNWIGGINVDLESSRELVDYERGALAVFSPSLILSRTYAATYLGRDRAEVKAVVDLFRRMYGRQGEFFMPSWTSDLVPIEALSSGSNTLKVAGRESYMANTADEGANSQRTNKAVAVVLKNGTIVTRRISTVTLVSGDTQFNMSSTWGTDYALSDIAMVCYMPLVRFASDKLTIEWQTATVAQFKISFYTLEYQAAE